MSYKQAVLRDNPIAFWPLNGTSSIRTYANILLEYATYQNWLDSELNYGSNPITFTLQDISSGGNHAAYTLGSPNFLDILPLATLSNYDTQTAGCKIDTNSSIGITNLPQYYNMFYTGTENLSFGIEFWLAFDETPSSDNILFECKYLNDSFIKIYVNNDKIFFTISGKDKITNNAISYTTYKQVYSWDSQMHIFAYYSNGAINISVNASSGYSTQVKNNFIFSYPKSYSRQFFYHVGSAEATNAFIINDLAFYDYVLSDNAIRSHMIWGTHNASPQNYVQQTEGFSFDIKESENMYVYKKDFSNPSSYKQGGLNNLIIDGKGLTLQTIPNLLQIGTDLSTSSGHLTVSNTSSAKFSNFSKYFSLNKMSILGQINWVSNTGNSPATILSIEGINNDEWFYLAQDSSNKLTLYYHSVSTTSPYDSSSTILAQLSSQNTAGTYNFGISFNGGVATIYLSNTGIATTTNIPSYTYSNLNLYFGNEYTSDATIPLAGSIQNISILPTDTPLDTYSNYGQYDSTTITFNNTLAISQIGTWTFTVPSSQFSKIVGSRVVWDSGSSDNTALSLNQYVTMQFSQDYGNTWSSVGNSYPITKFADSSSVEYTDTVFKSTIFVKDSSSLDLPRMDNVYISFYKDLSLISDSGAFLLQPRQGTYNSDTYAIRNNFFNILSRPENFGIKLGPTSNGDSIATITSTGLVPGYQTVEFWFKYDNKTSSLVQVILDTIGQQATVYIDPTTNYLYQVGLDNLYVNGLSLTSAKTLTEGEAYHIVCVYPYQTSSMIYLGGDINRQNFSYGIYGYINLYQTAFTQTQAQNRYLSFLASNASQVDYSTLLSDSDNVIGTIAEYSGLSTAYNKGQAILSYPHPSVTSV
jgi:hypothetical protein